LSDKDSLIEPPKDYHEEEKRPTQPKSGMLVDAVRVSFIAAILIALILNLL